MSEEVSSEAVASAPRTAFSPNILQKGQTKKYAALARVSGYALVAAGFIESMTGKAYASSTVDITNISNILDFLGNVILVVGVVMAGWNLVQAGQAMKDNQGFQMDKNVWGIIGGIAMAVAGGAMKTAGGLWNYGSAS